MIPPFDIEGGPSLALARCVSVAGLLAAFGSLAFARWLRPPELEPPIAVSLRRLSACAVMAAAAGLLIWLAAQTMDLAGDAAPANLWAVLAHTRFGHLLACRFCALLLALAALRRRYASAAAILCGAALLLQAGQSHAAAMGEAALLISTGLHLLAAGLWLGALPALWIVVSRASPAVALVAARRFSRAGAACVGVLLVTATLQFAGLVQGLPGLVGTGYGWMVGLKIVLFGALIALAARNRFSLAPALAGANGGAAARRLTWAIGAELVIGLLVVSAAAVLSELPPAMHLQPMWPFAERLSLVTVNEDPDFRREVIQAALALAGAAVLLLAALLARRLRLPSAVAAAVIAWFALPHLSLLLVEANPYSFFHSPTGFSARSIVQGASLYPTHCAACHGAEGHGDGPLASTLPVPPADLTAGHLWMHSDGDLFHWLTDGIAAPRGGQAMPGFAKLLSDDERWALIDYARAHNAGTMMQAMGNWMPPVQAPAFDMQCGRATQKLDALRGQPVRLILGGTGTIAAEPGMITILAAQATNIASVPGVCTSYDPTVPRAYAIVGGAAPTLPPGTQFLIDAEGWLRAIQRPGAPESWNDPKALAAALAAMRANRLAPQAPAPMSMNMPM